MEVSRSQIFGLIMRANVWISQRSVICPPRQSMIARAALRQPLPEALDSQLDTLGLLIVGAVQRLSSQAAKIARAMPLVPTQCKQRSRCCPRTCGSVCIAFVNFGQLHSSPGCAARGMM